MLKINYIRNRVLCLINQGLSCAFYRFRFKLSVQKLLRFKDQFYQNRRGHNLEQIGQKRGCLRNEKR